MAERRMFSKQIIDSDMFLDMPVSAQALYFHLAMRADDEGFLNNPSKIMKIVGANKNDMDILIIKKFIIDFPSGIIVIKHWYIHNYIQNDRFRPTVYDGEKLLLDRKENKVYTLRKDQIEDADLFTQNSDVYSLDTQVSIGKDSIDKKRKDIEQKPLEILVETKSLFGQFWLIYPRKVGRDKCFRWFETHKISNELFNDIIKAIENQKKWDQWQDIQFIPHPYTWLNRGGWNDEQGKKESNHGKDSEPIKKDAYIPRRDRQNAKNKTDDSE